MLFWIWIYCKEVLNIFYSQVFPALKTNRHFDWEKWGQSKIESQQNTVILKALGSFWQKHFDKTQMISWDFLVIFFHLFSKIGSLKGFHHFTKSKQIRLIGFLNPKFSSFMTNAAVCNLKTLGLGKVLALKLDWNQRKEKFMLPVREFVLTVLPPGQSPCRREGVHWLFTEFK